MGAVLTMLALLTIGAGNEPPRRVAVVYSSWGDYAFREEWDAPLKALGWRFEGFENTKTADLVARLDEFDIVVAASVANYEHTVDMAPHADAWRRFVERGGLLLITDASYDSVLDKWLGRLGPTFALRSEPCPKDRAPGGIPVPGAGSVLTAPVNLGQILGDRATIWAHLTGLAPAWRPLMTERDKGVVLAMQDLGRGSVVVTSHFSLKGADGQAAASPLVANSWLHCQARRRGVSLSDASVGGPRPGQHAAHAVLANDTTQALTYRVSLSVLEPEAKAPVTSTKDAAIAPGATLDVVLPYRVSQRGDTRVTLSISAGAGDPVDYEFVQHVPAMLNFDLRERHLYPWQDSVAYTVSAAPPNDLPGDAPRLGLRVDGGAERPLPLPETGAGVATVGKLELGPHTLVMALRHGADVLASVERRFTVHPTPRVYVRPGDLVTLVDGKPFFPMGFYHVSWPFPAEDRLACLREIAAAGYNTLHASQKGLDEWQPLLDEADRLGVKVITEFGVDMTKSIERYRGHRAVLAWNPGDEPDGQGVAPEEMLARHNRIKDADATVPTYMTLCVPTAYPRYAAMAEVIAPDPYPIHTGGADLDQEYEMIAAAVRAATPLGRPIWAIPQAFGYAKPNTWRVPKPDEERALTYLALIAGAKGLVYYTYRDQDFDMRANPALWAAMKALPAEIRRLQPWLLEGQRTDLSSADAKVRAAVWTQGGRRVACLANPTTAEQPVDLPLVAATGLAELLPGQAPTLEVRGGRLVGKLAPLAVEVVEVK
ncbi:MAG: hypothetical protein HZB16_18675 [Armatimonadetes bacterium]|nr:hypothetical protein [Armatimonadota bacterium]